MRMTRYEPWGLLNQFYKDLDQVFSQPENRVGSDDNTTIATSAWIPSVDIKEEAQRFVIYADIPGIEPTDIEVTMENGVLTIKGERVSETKEERKDYKRIERSRGTFYRRFGLPDTADAENIMATGKNGVLEITIPKRAITQPRRIKVEA